MRSVSSASSGAGTSDVTWTRTQTPTSRRDSRSSKSEYWQYFSKKTTATGEVRAYCNFCTTSYKVRCTSNMGIHMMSNHSTKMVPVDQPTLMNRFTNQLELVKVPNYLRLFFIKLHASNILFFNFIQPFSNEYAKEALLEMVISNNHPFTLVEEQSFIKFCAILNPHFKLTKNAFRNSIFRRYNSEKEDLIQYFKRRSIGMVSATTDLWTPGNNLAMMAIT